MSIVDGVWDKSGCVTRRVGTPAYPVTRNAEPYPELTEPYPELTKPYYI